MYSVLRRSLRDIYAFILPVSIILRTSAGPHLDFNSQIDSDRTSILWRPPVCLQVDGRPLPPARRQDGDDGLL